MKLQIYYIDRYMIYIKLFAALKRRLSEAEMSGNEKRAAYWLPSFLKGWN